MQIEQLKDTECLETSEGLMRPLVFGENIMVFHLEILPQFKVQPHAHEGEGFLYCLSGELEVSSNKGKVSIGPGTAMLIPSGMEVGIENKQESSVEVIIVGSPPIVKSIEELKELLRQHEVQNKE